MLSQTGDHVARRNQPVITRKPEIIHGLRNLIQNAVDFASHRVWIETSWTETSLSVRIMDDGAGFPPHIIGRIGDPFMRERPRTHLAEARPEYEGMGLGLFIAKTLLERSGATLRFANGSTEASGKGAVVEVIWPRDGVESASPLDAPRTGFNQGLRPSTNVS